MANKVRDGNSRVTARGDVRDDSPDTDAPTPKPENPDCGGGDGCGRK
ncbi:hypothetical protein SAMN05421773_10626 [Streptomyces aidingensis]|uniref:Uncharacterized protein n=1 Tax=Streptomyces aidingensis TaxID=910347 RepID=A0A1I1M5B0_9ACTN|nr:hypothetical protein SAMN05421773_10626 [Streptomyces aidingensis]